MILLANRYQKNTHTDLIHIYKFASKFYLDLLNNSYSAILDINNNKKQHHIKEINLKVTGHILSKGSNPTEIDTKKWLILVSFADRI